MAKGKNVLTTGDVAKICNVAPRTVSKWFDTGQLKGYRIPGSKDRRIPRSELIRFMKEHNIPTAPSAIGEIRVLLIDSTERAESLAQELRIRAGYDVQTAATNFEAGIAIHRFSPHVIVVNLLAEGIDAAQICNTIRQDDDLQATRLVALVNQLSQSELNALLQRGFDDSVCPPANAEQIIRKVEQTTAIVY